MNIEIVVGVLQAIVLFVLGVGVKAIFRMSNRIQDLSNKQSEMNGSVREAKVWRDGYEKYTDQRFETMDKNLSAVWRKVDHQTSGGD